MSYSSPIYAFVDDDSPDILTDLVNQGKIKEIGESLLQERIKGIPLCDSLVKKFL